jgi:hypothetical protein
MDFATCFGEVVARKDRDVDVLQSTLRILLQDQRKTQSKAVPPGAGCWVLGCPCLMWSQETMSRNITFHRVGQGKND